MQPLVTVLLPVYNGEKYLRLAVESILNQTYKNLDILVIDDGSTDQSESIILSYNDNRIRFVKNERNLGLTATFNKGIDLALGKYVARMDADDIAINARIEKQVNYLELHPDVTMVDTIMEYIDAEGNSLNRYNSSAITESEILKNLPKYNCLGHSSILIKKDTYAQYKYNVIAFEDYDLWLRLVNHKYKIHKIAEPLLLYRLHNNSYTDQSKINKSHTIKSAKTKKYYLEHITSKERFKLFNIAVFYHMVKEYAIGYIKYYKRKLLS